MAKKMYVGAPKKEVVTSTNLASWFTFSDPDGISSWSGNTITITGTYESERVKFTALQDMTISFDYTKDDFSKISLAGQYICENGDSGTYTVCNGVSDIPHSIIIDLTCGLLEAQDMEYKDSLSLSS